MSLPTVSDAATESRRTSVVFEVEDVFKDLSLATPLFDSKAVTYMPSIDSVEIGAYSEWLDKVINRIDHARAGYGNVLTWVKQRAHKEEDGKIIAESFNTRFATECKDVNTIMEDKTTGIAKEKYKAK